jgi:para-nitrobenzyl esterase
MLEQAMGTSELAMSEDCLTLNIFAPVGAQGLPVLVWIHGGAFTNGTAHASWYDGSSLAARGCVVVTINYRLGAFGFAGRADLGLQDQITALTYVQQHVADFGGDPANVSLFGESAGGCSVLALFAAPAAKSLFVRGWAMSPSIGQLRTTDRADKSVELLLDDLGGDSLDDLAQKSTQEIVAAQSRLLRDPKDVVTMFSPTIGGDVVPSNFHDHIAEDQRELVVGTLRDESRLWVALNPAAATLTSEAARDSFATRFGTAADRAWETYTHLRPAATPAQMLAAMQSDESFRVPAWKVIDARDRSGSPTWSYFFTWPTPVFDGILGACHGLDIPFVFDNLAAPNVEFFIGPATDCATAHRTIADALAGALVEFATNGRVAWQPTNGKRTTLRVDEQVAVVADPERAIYDLWSPLMSELKP